jgi:predicted GNAT superfamily acetyltransferase
MKNLFGFIKIRSILRKVILNEILAGFLLVLPMNIPYKSLNYSWFSERYNNFAYIDRIAVKEEFKSSGIGTLLYTDLEKSLPKRDKNDCM